MIRDKPAQPMNDMITTIAIYTCTELNSGGTAARNANSR